MDKGNREKTPERAKESKGLTRSGSAVIRVPAPPWSPETIKELEKKASDYIDKKSKKAKA